MGPEEATSNFQVKPGRDPHDIHVGIQSPGPTSRIPEDYNVTKFVYLLLLTILVKFIIFFFI